MVPVAVLSMAVTPLFVTAQDQPQGQQQQGQGNGGGGGGGGGGGQRGQGRGNFDPAQFRQRMLDNVKEQLGASDEEMTVLTPKLEKVFAARRDANAGGGFGGFGGGQRGRGGPGGGGGGDNQPQSAVGKATQDLRTTLENKSASADEITAKLTALRDARAKAQEELKASQKELKELVTARQEAVLVSMGMLE